MMKRASTLLLIIVALFAQTRTSEEIILTNPDILKYDSLFQVYYQQHRPKIIELRKKAGYSSFTEAAEHYTIPDELFLPYSNSLIICNLFYHNVHKTGDFDIYGGPKGGFIIKNQILRSRSQPWEDLLNIHGYVLVEVLNDPRTFRDIDYGFDVSVCKVVEDVIGNIESDTIIVRHSGHWLDLNTDTGERQQILIAIQTGSFLKTSDSSRERIYHTSPFSGRNQYCIVNGDTLLDKGKIKMLYKKFNSYASFKSDVRAFLDSIKQEL